MEPMKRRMPFRLKLCLAIALVTAASVGQAEEIIRQDIRLMGTDLIDDLVYSWLVSPPLGGSKGVVLTEVNAPIGLDERFGVTVENRLYEVISHNPGIKINLHHCNACTTWITKSNPTKTIISRGIDQPDALAELSGISPDLMGLSLHFEAEARELVLRAKIYELRGSQRIVWAQTYSTSMSSRRLLRDAYPLISVNEAREEQQRALAGRDVIQVSTRTVIRIFNVGGGLLNQAPLPFIEQSLETILGADRNTRAGLTVGFSSLREAMEAWSFGGHYSRLLFERRPSLISPDLYFTMGFHYIRMRGPTAAVFGAKQLEIAQLAKLTKEPKASLVNYRIGLEAHIKYRLGFIAFLENVPILDDNESFEEEEFLAIPYHLYGVGVVFLW
jgi:hypothetical protein